MTEQDVDFVQWRFRWELDLVARSTWYAMAAAVTLFGCSTPDSDGDTDTNHYPSEPLSIQDALTSFTIDENFRIEVFAAEPHVVEPVDIAFDAKGRAFAVEMHDFPYETAAGDGQSRIVLLEDSDGDGFVDTSTVFADHLSEATSIQPWNDGLLVTAAPEILFLKDTDGDNKADLRKILFTGFDTKNLETQITNLHFAVDNWIYASNTGNPGMITFAERQDAPPVEVKGGDFRFRLDREQFESASGPAQFGQAIDDWGNRFLTQNTVHVRHAVIPQQYIDRNPFLSSAATTQDISKHSLRMFQITEPPYWRAVRTERRNERYQREGLDRVEHASGYFSGATGGTIYSGHTFGKEYYGNLFTAEISGNLIHRDVLRTEGATFGAYRAKEEEAKDFLTSTDPWFRPANLDVGPDGNLYVIDMYRLHVEQPISIPEDLRKDVDFSLGDTHGRIYRIIPNEDTSSRQGPADLSQAETGELVELLSHPNGWQRLTAQRLLLEQQDQSAVPSLRRMLTDSESPQGRLHSLYALEALSQLDADTVGDLLDDPHPGVRQHAVRLAERFPALLPELSKMVEDSSPHVVFQVILSLGEFSNDAALSALASVASKRAQDQWFQVALLSSESGSSVSMLEMMVNDGSFFGSAGPGKERFLAALAEVVGKRNEGREVEELLRLFVEAEIPAMETWQAAGLTGLAKGLSATVSNTLRASPKVKDYLGRLAENSSPKVQSAAGAVARNFNL